MVFPDFVFREFAMVFLELASSKVLDSPFHFYNTGKCYCYDTLALKSSFLKQKKAVSFIFEKISLHTQPCKALVGPFYESFLVVFRNNPELLTWL
jgi:hypothetical protein